MVYWLPSAWTYGIKPAGTFLHQVAATWNAFSQTHLIAGSPNQVPDSWAALWYNSCIGRSIAALPCRSPHHTPCKWGCNVLQSCLLCLMMYLIYVITIPFQSWTFFSAGVFLWQTWTRWTRGQGAKPTYNPGLPIDAYPISLLASGLRSGLVCHEPLQFWHQYVSGQPPSMKKYEKNPVASAWDKHKESCSIQSTQTGNQKDTSFVNQCGELTQLTKSQHYIKLFFAGASDSLPCMWPTFAGARVKRKKTGSTLRLFSGVVEWCILQPCTVYCLSTRFSVSIHFGAWRPPKGTLDFRSSAMRW